MRKITLFFLLLMGTTAFAQFPESFEGAFPPAGWTTFRGVNNIGVLQDWTTSTAVADVNTGTRAAYVRWEDVTGGLAEDWMVTPAFTVSASNPVLSFFQRQSFTAEYGTEYTIRVSTTSQTDHASFTIVNTQTEADVPTVRAVKAVDLSAYIGQTIYVAFVMTNDDGDTWAVDDVDMIAPLPAAPECATVVSPADGAINVVPGGITFAWEPSASGSAATSYDLFYGLTPGNATILVGNYTTTSQVINVDGFNTTFYWKIVPKNITGNAVGCVEWSFTTSAPTGFCLGSPNGQFPATAYTPETCDGITVNTIATNSWTGEYSVVNVVEGETYIFNSSVATDIVTISADNGVTAAAFGTAPLTWVSTLTGTVRFYLHNNIDCETSQVSRVKSIVCGIPTNDQPDYVNLQFPGTATITQNSTVTVYAQIYEGGLTDVEPNIVGQAPGITAWIGVSPEGENTNPDTWTNWIPATWNAGSVGNNDEYQADLGTGLTPGTYYYASRFRLNNGPFVYGGYSAGGGNFWDGTSHLSGVLTVEEPPFTGCLNDPNGLWPTATFIPACAGSVQNITTAGYAGEYSNVQVENGTEYTFSSSIETDRITISNADGTSVLAFGVGSVTWTSSVTGVIRFFTHEDNACSENDDLRTRRVLCGAIPPAPANDECLEAIALTAGGVFDQNAIVGTNFGATASSNEIAPTCGLFQGSDVWYSVVIPDSGTLTIQTLSQSGSAMTDSGMAVYSGSCGNLTQLACNDDNPSGGNFSILTIAGPAGSTVYVRVWSFGSTSQGQFRISAYDASLSTATFDNTSLKYYPNPVRDVLDISYATAIQKVTVTNLLGQQMLQATINATEGQVDLSSLSSGAYLVTLTTEDQMQKTFKIIKN